MGLASKLKKKVKSIVKDKVSKSPIGSKLPGIKSGGAQSGVGRLANNGKSPGVLTPGKPGGPSLPLKQPKPTGGNNPARTMSNLGKNKTKARRTGPLER